VEDFVRSPPVRAAAATAALCLVPLGVVVACGSGDDLRDAIQGTWNCSSTWRDGDTGSATVVVGDGTFQFTTEGAATGGTWKQSGENVTIRADDGQVYQLFDLPRSTDKSTTFKIKIGKGEPTGSTATFDGKTLRFAVRQNHQQIHCVKK
jgi:hypothetical protein